MDEELEKYRHEEIVTGEEADIIGVSTAPSSAISECRTAVGFVLLWV